MILTAILISLKILALLMFGFNAQAQITEPYIDTVSKHVNWYAAKKAAPSLFVHLDKTVYVNNEVIWLAAYLLDADKNLDRHQILALSLVNTADQKIAVESKFPMAGGIGFGNMIIPDTVPAGNYSFVAQTNVLNSDGKPNAVFIQPITIKSATATAFNASLMLDTLYKDPDNIRVMVNVSNDKGPIELANINYLLGKDKKTRLTGEGKTSLIGSYILLIPQNKVGAAQHNLEVQVKYAKEIKALHLDIPVKQPAPNVKFYPEGGHLIAGLNNCVGWEVKTQGGAPVKTTGVLYMNNKAADTIEADSYGIGQFSMIPLADARYEVKLLTTAKSTQAYQLPEVLPSGVTMHMVDAFADDTVSVKLLSAKPARYTVVVHNFKQVFLTTDLQLSAKTQGLKIDVGNLPRGLNTITILDNLNRPVAERLFFAHYTQKPVVDIKVDVNEPTTRQKINVQLSLKGVKTKNAKGLVSVACVQDNRFEIKKENNIEHYTYLQSQIDDLPMKEGLMGTAGPDRYYLNQLLLVRGWRKYNWPEMMRSSAADTVENLKELLFTGTIKRLGGPLKKQVDLIVIKDTSNISILNTENNGNFTLLNNTILRKTNSKIKLVVSGQSNEFEIKMNDPYKPVQQEMAKGIEPYVFEKSLTDDTREFALSASQKVTNLREVKIKAKNDNSLYGLGGWGANACGDYVCGYHILNCPNHRNSSGNRQPRVGEKLFSALAGQNITYLGCTIPELKPGMALFDGLSFAKEFYGSDYAIANPTQPEYVSTIYWNKRVVLSQGNETNLSFYTSDITGKFRIVVQGITNEDVVYGETSFEVKKK